MHTDLNVDHQAPRRRMPSIDARPHGTRRRYLAGCRCDRCRRANAEYEKRRNAAWRMKHGDPLVPADRARAHLLKLSRLGVGRRAAAAASDLSHSLLQAIGAGRRRLIRRSTEQRILAVTKDCRADRSLVSAKKFWQYVENLVIEGYSKRQIALAMGRNRLHFSKVRVTARTLHDIARAYRRLTC